MAFCDIDHENELNAAARLRSGRLTGRGLALAGSFAFEIVQGAQCPLDENYD